MKTLVAFPSTGVFGQQAALAFHEVGELDAFITTFAHRPNGTTARLLGALPGRAPEMILRELSRRAVIPELPDDKVETFPFWEVLRTGAAKIGVDAPGVDRIWDRMSKRYTRAVGARTRPGSAVYAYEYTALEAFTAADRVGAAKILDFPSLNSRQFEELARAQKAMHPELVGPHDAYFDALFEIRQARRDAEMQAADVIITNSSVTRASHIAGGADPAKTFAVPCGAPPALDSLPQAPDQNSPLNVIWAGSFSIRKGAHLFIEAWRRAIRPGQAVAQVYGAAPLPERLRNPAPEGMVFHGSVVRSRLFAAFEQADVMMFPTLSDGFGMVVTEAFARGLPVITTDQAGASDLVRHGKNGLIIEAGDAEAIADALRWCLDNRATLAAMRPAALETARGWQWSDYRAALRAAVTEGLARAGKGKAAA